MIYKNFKKQYFRKIISMCLFVFVVFISFGSLQVEAATRVRTLEFFGGQDAGSATNDNSATAQNFPQQNVQIAESSVDVIDAYVELTLQHGANAATTSTEALIYFDTCAPTACTPTPAIIFNSAGLGTNSGESQTLRFRADVSSEATLAAFTGGTFAFQIGYCIDGATGTDAGTCNGTAAASIQGANAKLVVTYTYDDTSATQTNTVIYPLESNTTGPVGSKTAVQAACTMDSNCPTFSYNANIPEISSQVSQFFNVQFSGGSVATTTDHQFIPQVNGNASGSTIYFEQALSVNGGWMNYLVSGLTGYANNSAQALETGVNGNAYVLGGENYITYTYANNAATKTKTIVMPVGEVQTAGSTVKSALTGSTVYFPESGVNVEKAWFRVHTTAGGNTTPVNLDITTKVGGNAESGITSYSFTAASQGVSDDGFFIHMIPSADYTELESATADTGKLVQMTADWATARGAVSAELVITYTYTSDTNGFNQTQLLFGGQSTAAAATSFSAASGEVDPYIYTSTGTKTILGVSLLANGKDTGALANQTIGATMTVSPNACTSSNTSTTFTDTEITRIALFKSISGVVTNDNSATYTPCYSSSEATIFNGRVAITVMVDTRTVTISGTTNLSNASNVIKVAINGSVDSATGSISSGTWSITPTVNPTSGQVVVVFVDGQTDANESTAVSKYDGTGTTMSGMVLNAKTLTIGSEDNQSLTLTNLDTYDCVSDEDVIYSVTSSVLNIEGQGCAGGANSYTDETLSVLASNTITIGSSETLTTEKIINAGTITSTTTATYNITGTSGTLFTNTGTFTEATSTVNVTSASGTPTLLSAAETFHILNINSAATVINAGATITIADAVGSKLYVQSGVLNDSGNGISTSGSTNNVLQIDAGATLCLGGAAGANTSATCDTSAASTTARSVPSFATYTLNTTSTVIYMSDAATTVNPSPTYGNLILSPLLVSTSRTYSIVGATGTLNVNGNFTINPNESGAGAPTLTVEAYVNLSIGGYTLLSASSSALSTLDLKPGVDTYNLYTGFLRLNPNATLDASGSSALIRLTNGTGTLFVAAGGTFSYGTSTVDLTGNGDATINSGSPTFYNLTSSGTGTKGLGAGITLATSGTLNISAGIFNPASTLVSGSGSNTLTIGSGATLYVDTLDFTSNYSAGFGTFNFDANSTVDYNRVGVPQNILNTPSYGNLKISGAGSTKTLIGTTSVAGTLTVSSGTLQLADQSITVTGATSITGTIDDNNTSGTNIFIGAVTVNNGGTWTSTGNDSYEFRGGLTVNSTSTFTSGSGTYAFTANSQTVTGTQSFTITNLLNSVASPAGLVFPGSTVSVGTFTQDTSAFVRFTGAMPAITTLVATATGNYVCYDGASQTMIATTYENVDVDITGTLTLGGNVVVGGTMYTFTGTTVDTDVTNNYSLTAGVLSLNNTTFNARASTITLTGTGSVFVNSGTTFNAGTSTIKITDSSATGKTFAGGGGTYNNFWFAPGTGTGTLTITGANTFADFKDDGTGAHTIVFPAGVNTTITSLTLDTNSAQLITLQSSSPGSYWNLVDTVGTNTVSYVSITDSCASGGATWTASDGTNVDGGHNCGWSFVSLLRYWVGGTASWDGTAGTKWATCSGCAGGASVPTSVNDVYFDGNSGAVTVTIATGNTGVKNLIFTGFTGTLAGSAAISISGGLTMGAGMTNSYTGTMTFDATSGTHTITSNGKTLNSSVTFNGVGGTWQLGDAMNNNGYLTLTNGTFNTSNYALTAYGISSSNSNVRSMNLGSSTIIFQNASNPITLTTTTNLTFNAGTSNITMSQAGSVSANMGGLTYYDVSFTGGGASYYTYISGTNTFHNLSFIGTAIKNGGFYLSANQTVNGTFTVTGNSATNRVFVWSGTIGTTRTITAAAVSLTNVDFMDITGAGAASPFTGTSLGDALGNSGITFTTPVTRYWVGNGGNWSDTNEWSTASGGSPGASVPLPQDTVIFNANSISSGGQTIYADMPRLGKDINFTGVSNSPTLDVNINTMYGSLTLGSGMSAGGNSFTMAARSSVNLTSNGVTTSWGPWNIETYGGSVTLQDALVNNNGNGFNLNYGTLDANNQNVTLNKFASNNGATRTVTMGSGTWELTGTSYVWNIDASLTVNANTSTLKFTDTSTSAVRFVGANKTYNNIWFARGSSTGDNIIFSGNNTFNEFKDTGSVAHNLLFGSGTTQTITTWTVSGTAGNLITINTNGSTATHTLTKAGSGYVSADYLNIQHSVATGGNGWYAGANSTNNQGVATIGSGWIFTAPVLDITISTSSTTCGNAPSYDTTLGGCIVNTTDIQNYLNAGTSVSITAGGNITVSNTITKSSGSANSPLSLYANGNITISAAISASTFGTIGLLLNADRDASTSGYVNIAGAITTNGGNITIGGGSGTISAGSGYAVGNAGQAVGVYVNGVAVAAGGGNVIVNGQGYNTTTDSNYGVQVTTSGAITTTGLGTISINGQGGGASSDSNFNYGVSIDTDGYISAENGNVSVTGVGGGAGAGVGSHGVYVNGINSTIQTTGSGGITLVGTGGNASGSGGFNLGFYCNISDYCIRTTGTGTISVTGTGGNGSGSGVNNSGIKAFGRIVGNGGAMTITGNGGNSSEGYNDGIFIDGTVGGYISNTGSGTLSITAVGGGASGNSSPNYGLNVSTGGIISTVNGNLTVTATGGGAGTGINNYGVYIAGASSTIKTTGSGNLILNGIRGGGDSSTNYGTYLAIANALQTTGTGNITVNSDTILLTEANDINSIGNLTIRPYTATTTVGVGSGTGTLALTDAYLGYLTWGASSTLIIGGTSSGDVNINTASTILNKNVTFISGEDIGLATTALTHSGASAATLTMQAYKDIVLSSAISANTTPLNIILQSDYDGNSSGYANIAGAITSNGGNITIGGGSGTISAGSGYALGNSGQATGVYINGVTVAAGGGNVIINGRGYNTTTNSNHGVHITGASGSVTTTGSGTININALGGGDTGTSGSNYGLYLASGGDVTSADGNITIVSVGGGNSSGASNYGTHITGANSTIKTTGTGSISLTTTGGGDIFDISGSNMGLYCLSTGACLEASGAGNITVVATGSNGSGGSQHGVYLNTSTSIVAAGGDISITGNSGMNSGIANIGLLINAASITTTGDGDITLVGTGNGTGANGYNYGIDLGGASTVSTVNGNITVSGNGGGGNGSTDNYGVYFFGTGPTVKTTGTGNITINAQDGFASSALYMTTQANAIQTLGSGSITVNADSITLGAANNINSVGALTIAPYTASTTMGVAGGSGSLGLTSTYLGYITYGTSFQIGDADQTGLITVGAYDSWAKPISFIANAAGSGIAISGAQTNTNSFTFSGPVTLSSNNLTATTLTIAGGTFNAGSSTITLSGAGNVFSNSGTFTAGTSTIKLTDSSASLKTFNGGGGTYYNFWYAPGAGTGNLEVKGSNTFNNFKDTGTMAHSILFTAGTTQTLNSWTVSGNAGQLITINSGDGAGGTSTATHALINNSNSAVDADYLSIQHSVATPYGWWFAGENSTDNNSIASAGSGWFFFNNRVYRGGGSGNVESSATPDPQQGGGGVGGGGGGVEGGGDPGAGQGGGGAGGGDGGVGLLQLIKPRLLASAGINDLKDLFPSLVSLFLAGIVVVRSRAS